MGKAALLAIAAFVILSSYYTLASRDGQASTLRVTSKHQMTVLARHAAVAGYAQAKQAITDDDAFPPFKGADVTRQGAYEGATYHVTISSDGTTVTVRSVGTMRNALDEVHFTVHAVIGYTASVANDVPSFLTYALLTEDDLHINGNVGGFVDDQESTFNANFHTNGDLHVDGNSADVAGFGSYTGIGTSNPSEALASTFQPHYNPDELETVYQSAPVDIPPFNADSFLENVMVDESSPGPVVISGDLDLGGTRDDPYVWHVGGNLSAIGGSTVSGYVMFVVEGDINLTGNLVAGGEGEESTVALYAGEDVTMTGSVQIHGQIYAHGDAIFNGTPDIYGSVASRSRALLSGTPAIYYRPASPALTSVFSGGSALRLLSYHEH